MFCLILSWVISVNGLIFFSYLSSRYKAQTNYLSHGLFCLYRKAGTLSWKAPDLNYVISIGHILLIMSGFVFIINVPACYFWVFFQLIELFICLPHFCCVLISHYYSFPFICFCYQTIIWLLPIMFIFLWYSIIM